jgi:hypothetical protein
MLRRMATRTPKHKDSELERWTAVLLRSVHLAGVVWVGAFVVADQPIGRTPALLMLVSGLVMLAMDLRAGRLSLREVAGAFVLVKLALVAWMALDPRQAVWVFWLLLVASSVSTAAAIVAVRNGAALAQKKARSVVPASSSVTLVCGR